MGAMKVSSHYHARLCDRVEIILCAFTQLHRRNTVNANNTLAALNKHHCFDWFEESLVISTRRTTQRNKNHQPLAQQFLGPR